MRSPHLSPRVAAERFGWSDPIADAIDDERKARARRRRSMADVFGRLNAAVQRVCTSATRASVSAIEINVELERFAHLPLVGHGGRALAQHLAEQEAGGE